MRKLFTPIKIGDLEIKNRFMMAPMENGYGEIGGKATPKLTQFLTERAKNEIGIVISCSTAVSPEGRGLLRQLGIYEESYLPKMKQMVDGVHQAGSKFGVQLYHAGRQATADITGLTPVGPSAVPCPILNNRPRAMEPDDFTRILNDFVIGTRRAIELGFDLIEVHFAHGYLLHSFLSPHSNKRTDEFGGSLENRMRYPFQVLDAIIKEAADRVPVTIRISIEEFLDDGLKFEEAKKVCLEAEKYGIKAISISAAGYDSIEYVIQPMFIPRGFLIDYARDIKQSVNIPVIVAGRLNDAQLIEEIIENGSVDMVAIGRGFIADEQLALKIKNKDYDSIRYCIACNQGCLDKVLAGEGAKCLVNPRAGYEDTRNITPAATKKNVVVIGAGSGGLEAARIAKERGHNVTVLDKVRRIGGKLKLVAAPPEKDEFLKFRDYLYKQLTGLGIKFEEKDVKTPSDIKVFNPDAVVVATGALQSVPPFKVADNSQIIMAEDILKDKQDIGDTVVVIGGGFVGVETAKYLCRQNKKVHIVEMLDAIGMDYGSTYAGHNLSYLAQKGVVSHIKSKVVEIQKGKVIMEHGEINADSVVIAVGYHSDTTLYDQLKKQYKEVYLVGDAKEPRRILDAVSEGFEAGNQI